MANPFKRAGILPGFGLSLGFAVTYLSLIVLIPLAALVLRPFNLSWDEFVRTVTARQVLAAYATSFQTALFASLANFAIGLVLAWTLVRYRFPWRRLLDTLVDIPFALPTAVAGIALATLFGANGWIGAPLANLGISLVNSKLGITLALIFIGFPFVVRTVQPVLAELAGELEEAAHSLGATRWQTFRRIVWPAVFPALLTGFTLSFARCIGEYGSVIFISGNLPYETEIAPLLIMAKLDQFKYDQAAAVAVVLLGASFATLLALNGLQRLGLARQGVKA